MIIRELIDTLKINNVIVMTTSDKFYNKKIVDFIRHTRSNNFTYVFDYLSDSFLEKYNDYFYNLLTDPNLSIESYYDSIKSNISKENFEKEYLGIWYK